MQSHSLITRLLVAVSILLMLFFGTTVVVLDEVFRQSSRQAISDRMEVELLALMAASEETAEHRLMPARQLLDPRFFAPNSGLYGEISTQVPAESWQSASLLGSRLAFDLNTQPGERRFSERTMDNGTRVLALSVGLAWEFADGRESNLVFSVAESMEQYYSQLSQFRVRLFAGFAAMSLLLLIALGLLFRYMLKPLRRIEREIEAIEAGAQTELGTGYPSELIGVTENMNALLRSERERMARYRKSLGNLAHSLKTPLAVLRNLINAQELRSLPTVQQLDEQVVRMDDIVRYQLRRAAASTGFALGTAPVALTEVIEPVVATLRKVYFERRMGCEMDIQSGCAFLADKGDLMEIVGNLLDNAFKYGGEQVRIHASNVAVAGMRRPGLKVVVDDDGPGITPALREQVLKRGARLDERPIGQGIGLSVVSDLAELYRGQVTISDSSLGGACVTVLLQGS